MYAMTATFYTSVGYLLSPSAFSSFFLIVRTWYKIIGLGEQLN
jgi:hypothetical protein